MSLRAKLLSASGGVDKLYVDDVFSAYTYTGTGATQTINNGIDLAGKGGLVWIKDRGSSYTHQLFDTTRSVEYRLQTSASGAQSLGPDSLTAFNSNGYALGTNAGVNASPLNYVSWTFRKAPKFFDVVTYTGNAGTKTVPHSLGSAPGMIIVKKTNVSGTSSDWVVYHQAVPANCGFLNATSSFASAQRFSSVTASDFTINVSTADVNENSSTYVAYLFAHDASADGLIQCGSFTSTTSALNITLGWEPQFLLCKRSSGAAGWDLIDAARGFQVDRSGSTVQLSANTSAAEVAYGTFGPTATGFTHTTGTAGDTYIYLAIRRPNKPPTSGTDVFIPLSVPSVALGTKVTTGFAVDMQINMPSGTVDTYYHNIIDRLRGIPSGPNATDGKLLNTRTTGVEFGAPNGMTHAWDNTGFKEGDYSLSSTKYHLNFRRAPGVFDVVCYTGTGVNALAQPHNLGVTPELILIKKRSGSDSWFVGSGFGASTYTMALLESTGAASSTVYDNGVLAKDLGLQPTAANFYLGRDTRTNGSSATYVAYLFATKAGISKVFSYTGNGSSQTINCGFTTGARFILIKRTDSTGDWYVWDTVRGIIAGNDPHLSLNTTAAEVTTNDSIDPDSSGFIVNQVTATNINVTSATYIGLALA